MIKRIVRKAGELLQWQKNYWLALPANLFSKKRHTVIVLDDIYPLVMSPFRLVEFNYYLSVFPDSIVYTTGTALKYIGETKSLTAIMDLHMLQNPDYAGRVVEFNPSRKLKGSLAYVVFLHNTHRFLPIIEKNAIPFVFTLYPGGGFFMDSKIVNRQLKEIFNSKYFRKVIVTQKITFDYLVTNNLCPAEKIELVYGVVLPVEKLQLAAANKLEFKKNKFTFDLCFVANKYMPLGIDKGYDTFIAIAKKMSDAHDDVKFHIVGSFDASDIDVSGYDNIVFYGPQKTGFFPDFYAKMDIVVSPNVPSALENGAFDGFPTGGCIEAGLMGVALFCSDSMGQNVYFEHKTDIVIIDNNADNIVEFVEYYYNNYSELLTIAKKGQAKIKELFSIEAQLYPRVKVLQEAMQVV
ncbi:glycosyltransferase [Hymenobacter fastidiosus]|uniref:Glycosyltransferase n=1 Tax=Hymenobacter fastidiosus TaxID=486264 RepID=A0ABP7SRP4_9BACT